MLVISLVLFTELTYEISSTMPRTGLKVSVVGWGGWGDGGGAKS